MYEACLESGLAIDRASKTLQQGTTTAPQKRRPTVRIFFAGEPKRTKSKIRTIETLPRERFQTRVQRSVDIHRSLSLELSVPSNNLHLCPLLRSAPPHVRYSPTYAFFFFLTARPPTWIALHVKKHRSSIDLFQIDILSITCEHLVLHSSLTPPDPNRSPNPPRLIGKTGTPQDDNTKK